jgi:hypothetical protein
LKKKEKSRGKTRENQGEKSNKERFFETWPVWIFGVPAIDKQLRYGGRQGSAAADTARGEENAVIILSSP